MIDFVRIDTFFVVWVHCGEEFIFCVEIEAVDLLGRGELAMVLQERIE